MKKIIHNLLIVSVIIVFSSCKKDNPPPAPPPPPPPPVSVDSNLTSTVDYALVMESFSDIIQISDEASKGIISDYRTTKYFSILSNCAAVTLDTLNHADNDSIAIDFGSANCLCFDGRYRRGKLSVTYSAGNKYWDSLCVITVKAISADSFFTNNHQIISTIIATNNGHNTNGYLNWGINSTVQIIKANAQGTIMMNSNITSEWVAGDGTSAWSDDVHLYTGNASGTGADGISFTANITNAIIKKVNCLFIIQGNSDVTPTTKPIRHLDFGNGTCDNQASVTIDANTYIINLP